MIPLTLVNWIKNDDSTPAKLSRACYYNARNFSIPPLKAIYVPLRVLHNAMRNTLKSFMTKVYFTPMFKTYLTNNPKDLFLYSGMPQILGTLDITVGNNVRMSGISTFCGRTAAKQSPQLVIGDNVDIGWQNSISVGTRVEIQNHVRLAGKVFLCGFPGHPLNAEQRRLGAPETDAQAKPIVLEEDVWVGTGATIMGGVTIGKGSIVGAGAVVTQSVPPYCVVAGNPAKVVKSLEAYQ